MVGTLSGALEARKIPAVPDKVSADVTGTIKNVDGILKITKISVHYHLKIPAGTRSAAERALSVFERACPVSQTLEAAIRFEHTHTIEEY
ncbi:OsmC family protein [Bacillus sp. FJAT-27225]|uniref:OsmC family protein n=1 Tax=Bacillus sp. FJAT-27225 TaxID=1743144 RepID=UPI000981249B